MTNGGHFIRTVTAINDGHVDYMDQIGPGRCTRETFIKRCTHLVTDSENEIPTEPQPKPMKPIFIKTESGAIIEIECNAYGVVFIRHFQFQPITWAELKEYDHAEFGENISKRGGYVIIGGREFEICGSELDAIKDAVKNHTGNALPLTEMPFSEDERHATNELVSVVLTIQQYLATYGKMIREMAQLRQELLTPVQRETCPMIVKQILDSEAQIEILRRNLER